MISNIRLNLCTGIHAKRAINVLHGPYMNTYTNTHCFRGCSVFVSFPTYMGSFPHRHFETFSDVFLLDVQYPRSTEETGEERSKVISLVEREQIVSKKCNQRRKNIETVTLNIESNSKSKSN